MSPTERHDPKLKDLRLDDSADGDEPEAGVDDVDAEELSPEELVREIDEGEIDPEDLTEVELDEALDEEEFEEFEEREKFAAELKTAKAEHQKTPGPISRLYNGETSFDFVGRKKWWFLISSLIIVAGLLSLGIRGLNLGIDFKGGDAWIVAAPGATQTQATNVVHGAGLTDPVVELLGAGKHQQVEVQADLNNLPSAEATNIRSDVTAALAKMANVPESEVSRTFVGPSWGSEITKRAVAALIVFFIVVAIYISFRFEPKMAVAAFVAMVHDLLITIGVYSLAGFQVTPDTVIAILTILGYSLYDTVVVFDRVRDNTKGFGASGRMTYSEMINLSMNQTLARSINTSLVAILPVLAVLVVGAQILGATTLQDYGLALTVGLISGAYSSIFIAAPVLAWMKEREPRYTTIRQRLEARGDRVGLLTPAAAAAMAGATAGSAGSASARPVKAGKGARSGAIRPGSVSSRQKVGATVGGETAARSSSGGAGGSSKAGATAGGATRPARAQGGAKRPASRPRKGGKGKSKKRR